MVKKDLAGFVSSFVKAGSHTCVSLASPTELWLPDNSTSVWQLVAGTHDLERPGNLLFFFSCIFAYLAT
jgi:hypothetical protein